ncbi:hypothetical protein [Echinimonas agarilytica]|uniref:Peptidase M61 catalytic domain-containing protein n=1 Tax=Echinimonas agarilytica TaxID=1215918 RepID=A0AA41W5C1_9GAMM|nr:hypothetical protein [Echinimonas agarilytica]MCM2679011.1 hypothetical protein [Echinimonas agarilytica]
MHIAIPSHCNKRQTIKVLALLSIILWMTNTTKAVVSSTYFSIDKARIELRYQNSFTAKERAKISYWLRQHSVGLTYLYGQYPLEHSRYIIKKASSGSGPVPWAQVERGDPDSIVFHVNAHYSLDELMADWTTPHELSHLLIPYPGYDDIWLSEGLASLYQYLLPINVNLTSEHQAWQKLHLGFERGRNDIRLNHWSLQKLAARMHETGSFRRVYWSGAAYYLNVAYQLQSLGTSLPYTLLRFKGCCREANKEWTGIEFVRSLDQFNQHRLFERNYYQWLNLQGMPDLRLAYNWFGVHVNAQRITLDSDPKYQQRRLALYHWQPNQIISNE